MLRRIFASVLVAVAVGATASAQDVRLPEIEFGRYHALVIGNNDYRHLRNLTTAVGDAEAVAKLLEEKYGFEITKLINATRRDITGAFNRLRQTLTEKDNLLVYYAGHGVLDEEAGAGYWQPVDARSDDDSDWFSNTRLTNYLKAMSAKHVMVVADSCYSGNLTRVATSTVRSGAERTAWMQRMNQKRSRTALTSGGLEPVLDQGGGDHSVFAQAFLTALEENPDVLFGEELFDRVKGQVVANADQTPEYSDIRYTGHEKGDFLFVPRDIDVSATVQTTQPTANPDASAFELTFWRSIQVSDNPADFEAYLKRFPEGTFADLARNQLVSLKEKQTALAVPPKPKIEIDPIEAKYVAVTNASVRKEPTVRSGKVATLIQGTRVHVSGKVKDANWYLVEVDDEVLGYVFGDLLKDAETARQEEQAERLEEARRKEEESKRIEEAQRQAELVRQQEEERQHAQEARRREEERKRAEATRRATLAKQQELERQRAAEARQEETRKQAETAKLSMAVPPKPPLVYERYKPGDTFQDCPECPQMVVIPAGRFMMGSAKSETSRGLRRRGPQHQVTIARAFALGRQEVTYEQWHACLRDGGCTHRPSKSGRQPVTWVELDQALAYVRWLSRKTGQEYRLPSEAEWEYAGQRGNAFGLQGIGNDVWEWVEDCWNGDYNGAPIDGSAWTTGGCAPRVLRGGSWSGSPKNLRAANRRRLDTGSRFIDSGFRIARTLP